MAKLKKAKEVKAEEPKIKLKSFTLKGEYQGKKPGDSVKVGPVGEKFLKSKNII